MRTCWRRCVSALFFAEKLQDIGTLRGCTTRGLWLGSLRGCGAWALSKPFDLSRELNILRSAGPWARRTLKAGRHLKAALIRRQIEQEYDAETAEAVAAAIASGCSYQAILERASKRKAETAERERLLVEPPPLHGSAAWATAKDLPRFLRGRGHFDHPSSILLGTLLEEGASDPAGFVHWDGDDHLLTLAPTRAGKSVTTIIPNLLRYRGSVVVLDPKGELYKETSAWRAKNVGPVHRIAPFDDGADPTPSIFPGTGSIRWRASDRSTRRADWHS